MRKTLEKKLEKQLEKKCDGYKTTAIAIIAPLTTAAGVLADKYLLKGNGIIGGIAGYMLSAPLINIAHSYINKKYSLNH